MPSVREGAPPLPVKSPDLAARKIAGEYILVPVRGNLADLTHIFSLSPVAEHVWRELDHAGSFEELQRGIVERFEVDEQQAGVDLREFLVQLAEAGLVRG